MDLKNGNSTMSVNERGEVTSYVYGNDQFMWCGDAKYWDWHSPTLFPYCGRIKDKKAFFNGVEYTGLNIHGFARNLIHTVKKSGEKYCVVTVSATEETKKLYPYDFSLDTEYTLWENGYNVRFTVKNNGEGEMPFCIGSHPALMLPGKLEDCDLIIEGTQNALYYAADENGLFRGDLVLGQVNGNVYSLSFDPFRRGGMIFPALENRKSFSVKDRTTGKGFKVTFDDFPVCVLWMPSADCPFICVEPWCGLPDNSFTDGNFVKKNFVKILDKGEYVTLQYSIEPIK